MINQVIVPVMPHISSGYGHTDPKELLAIYIVLCLISLPSFIYSIYRWRTDKEFLGSNLLSVHFTLAAVFLVVNSLFVLGLLISFVRTIL